MIELTKAQKRVYVLLKRRWRERGSQPNLFELARELGIHYVSLKQHLDLLVKKDYLELESQGRGKQPIIRLRVAETGIPLVGEIAAGGWWDAEEHAEGFLKLPGRDDLFALKVKGDSVAEPIQSGDLVILKKARPLSGDVCAVRYEDETTLKYLGLVGEGRAELRPHNPAYDTLAVSLKEVYVAGVLDALLRGSIVDDLLEAA